MTTDCTVSSFQIGTRCSGKTETPSVTDLVCVCKAIIILSFNCVCFPGFVPKLAINNFHYIIIIKKKLKKNRRRVFSGLNVFLGIYLNI